MGTTSSYQELSAELDKVLAKMQAEDTDIEAAVKAYQRGIQIVQALEKQLKAAENKVKKIKLQFDQ